MNTRTVSAAFLLCWNLLLPACGDDDCDTLKDVCSYCDDLATATACSEVVEEKDTEACEIQTIAYADACDVSLNEDGKVVGPKQPDSPQDTSNG